MSKYEEGIDLLDVFVVLSENWIKIVVFPVAAALAAFAIALSITTYTATYRLAFPDEIPTYLTRPIISAAIQQADPASAQIHSRSATFDYSSSSPEAALAPVEAIRKLAVSMAREFVDLQPHELALLESEILVVDQFLTQERSTVLERANHTAALASWLDEEALISSEYVSSPSPLIWTLFGFVFGMVIAFILILARAVQSRRALPS